jgi:hypothetical protein
MFGITITKETRPLTRIDAVANCIIFSTLSVAWCVAYWALFVSGRAYPQGYLKLLHLIPASVPIIAGGVFLWRYALKGRIHFPNTDGDGGGGGGSC